jgi:hypothetical protein
MPIILADQQLVGVTRLPRHHNYREHHDYRGSRAGGTSENPVHLSWLIRVMRLIGGIPVPPINHEARINHVIQRAYPTKGANCSPA